MHFGQSKNELHPGTIYTLTKAIGLLGMGFHSTIYSLFLRDIGIKQDQIAGMNSLFWLTLILAELPTGMFADGKSRARSIKIGFLIESASLASYSLATGFWSALLSEVLIGVALAFLSGAEDAWISDALSSIGKFEELKKIKSTAAVWSAISALLGGVCADFVGRWLGFRMCWLIGALIIFVGFAVACKFMRGQGEPSDRLTKKEALKASFRKLKESRSLAWVVIANMCFGLVYPFNHYWGQFFDVRLNGARLSGTWIAMYTACAVAGYSIRRLNFKRGREAGALVMMLGLAGLGLSVAGHLPGVYLPLGMIVIHEIGRGAYVPLADVFIQRRIESGYRATYSSLNSLLGRSGNTIVLAGVWFFSRSLPDGESKIVTIWTTVGGLLVLASLMLYLFRPKTKISVVASTPVPETLPAQN
ncbi:MAG: MFS transporter [Patescibacteria group bacterium]|nr:MFS transporter [Patescibacteria group bacterium]